MSLESFGKHNTLEFIESTFIPNKKDEHGDTGQHWAAMKGDIEKLEWLYKQNADMSIANNEGFTPLHEIVSMAYNYRGFENAKKVILFLLEHGANKNAKDNNGETPLMIAKRKKNDWPEYQEIINLF